MKNLVYFFMPVSSPPNLAETEKGEQGYQFSNPVTVLW